MMLFRRCSDSLAVRVVVAGLACVLAACTLSRPSPVKQTYLLVVTLPTKPSTAPRPGTLKIGVMGVAAPFRGKVLVYRETDLKYETDFYNEFLVSPTAMLTDAASAWLAAAHVFRGVLPASANTEGDFVLEGFVSEFYGDFRDVSKPAAVITAKFFLIDNRSLGGVPMWQIELTQRVPINGRNADALVTGLNTAWGAMLAELAKQLVTVPLPESAPSAVVPKDQNSGTFCARSAMGCPLPAAVASSAIPTQPPPIAL
ncbi:MAG: hypothetical protein E6H66_02435 [Betaproteobacteria bacterium]|nr:MAG: hypothetical protein E6H66_02435 [Betaproteobacteria bacterium]